jgi:hypothetical protein
LPGLRVPTAADKNESGYEPGFLKKHLFRINPLMMPGRDFLAGGNRILHVGDLPFLHAGFWFYQIRRKDPWIRDTLPVFRRLGASVVSR